MPAPVTVIAHRGHHDAHPDNSLAAFASAIELGCDFLECDLRTDPRGRLVLKHDPLQPGDAPPLFDDLLRLAHNRAFIYLDAKQALPAAIVAAVEHRHMAAQTYTYGPRQLLLDLRQLRPSWLCMPEASTPDVLRENLRALSPPAVAFSGWNFKPPQIELARAAGCRLFLDRQGPTDNPAGWQSALDAGATGLQTDRPVQLLAWLRQRNLHP